MTYIKANLPMAVGQLTEGGVGKLEPFRCLLVSLFAAWRLLLLCFRGFYLVGGHLVGLLGGSFLVEVPKPKTLSPRLKSGLKPLIVSTVYWWPGRLFYKYCRN